MIWGLSIDGNFNTRNTHNRLIGKELKDLCYLGEEFGNLRVRVHLKFKCLFWQLMHSYLSTADILDIPATKITENPHLM